MPFTQGQTKESFLRKCLDIDRLNGIIPLLIMIINVGWKPAKEKFSELEFLISEIRISNNIRVKGLTSQTLIQSHIDLNVFAERQRNPDYLS